MTNQENQVKDLATRRPLEIKRTPRVPDVPKTRLIIRQRTRFGQAEVKRDISLFATTLTISLRPPDPGTGRVAGRTSYLLAETGFERSLSERARSLSEKQVKADKDLRRSAEE